MPPRSGRVNGYAVLRSRSGPPGDTPRPAAAGWRLRAGGRRRPVRSHRRGRPVLVTTISVSLLLTTAVRVVVQASPRRSVTTIGVPRSWSLAGRSATCAPSSTAPQPWSSSRGVHPASGGLFGSGASSSAGSAGAAGAHPGVDRRPALDEATREPILFPYFRRRPLLAEIPVVAEGGIGLGGLVGMTQPGMRGLGLRPVGHRRRREGPGRRPQQLLQRPLGASDARGR